MEYRLALFGLADAQGVVALCYPLNTTETDGERC